MADEELRLRATFQDQISGPIRGAIAQLRAFVGAGQQAHVAGEKTVKAHAESFKKLTDGVKQAADGFRQGFLPALEKTGFSAVEAGIGLGTVAAAIGAASAAAAGFAARALDFKRASRETGLSVDEVRRWEALGSFVGVADERMRSALGQFNNLVEQMQRRPDIFRSLFATPDTAGMAALRDFMLSMKDLPRQDQLDRIVSFVGQIRDIGQRQKVWEFLGFPKELASETATELRQYLASITGILTPWTAEQQALGERAALGACDSERA